MAVRSHVFILALALAGCAQGQCRRQSVQVGEAKPVDAADPAPSPAAAEKPGLRDDTMFVFKYDGSLQCGMGKPVALEVMAKELAGIPISSSMKKPDGLMHIQVCGSATGMANVYEIPAKFLKKAESKGFKKWSFE